METLGRGGQVVAQEVAERAAYAPLDDVLTRIMGTMDDGALGKVLKGVKCVLNATFPSRRG